MARVPTLKVLRDGRGVVINASNFNEETDELFNADSEVDSSEEDEKTEDEIKDELIKQLKDDFGIIRDRRSGVDTLQELLDEERKKSEN